MNVAPNSHYRGHIELREVIPFEPQAITLPKNVAEILNAQCIEEVLR